MHRTFVIVAPDVGNLRIPSVQASVVGAKFLLLLSTMKLCCSNSKWQSSAVHTVTRRFIGRLGYNTSTVKSFPRTYKTYIKSVQKERKLNYKIYKRVIYKYSEKYYTEESFLKNSWWGNIFLQYTDHMYVKEAFICGFRRLLCKTIATQSHFAK